MATVLPYKYSPILPNASSVDWISFSPSSTESVCVLQKWLLIFFALVYSASCSILHNQVFTRLHLCVV